MVFYQFGYASILKHPMLTLPVQVEKSGLEEVCKGKDEVLASKEQEIAAKERALSDERQRVSSLTDECATLGSELEQLTVSHITGASSDFCNVWQEIKCGALFIQNIVISLQLSLTSSTTGNGIFPRLKKQSWKKPTELKMNS